VAYSFNEEFLSTSCSGRKLDWIDDKNCVIIMKDKVDNNKTYNEYPKRKRTINQKRESNEIDIIKSYLSDNPDKEKLKRILELIDK
jgi:uncharacterized protein YqeY